MIESDRKFKDTKENPLLEINLRGGLIYLASFKTSDRIQHNSLRSGV